MKKDSGFGRALLFAVLLHVLLAVIAGFWWAEQEQARYWQDSKPIWLSLVPEERPPRRLIEVAEATQETPESADFIAEENSKAATPVREAGETPGPMARLGATDRLAAPPTEEAKPSAASLPAARGRRIAQKTEPAYEAPGVSGARPLYPSVVAPLRGQDEQQAAVLPAPAARPLPAGETETRERGASARIGFAGFEAIQSDLAPYLKSIQAKVELRWNEALLTRYFGTNPTVAEVRCEIAPDGSLVNTRILGAPKDVIFAGLCQHAIRRAAPFGAFPFVVPPEYRNQNLEIHWTFNFL